LTLNIYLLLFGCHCTNRQNQLEKKLFFTKKHYVYCVKIYIIIYCVIKWIWKNNYVSLGYSPGIPLGPTGPVRPY